MQLVHLDEGETVYSAGDIGHTLYVILKGTVSVSMEFPANDPTIDTEAPPIQTTTSSVIRTLNVGDAFGEISLDTNHPYVATTVCLERCYLATLSRNAYREILSNFDERKLSVVIEALREHPMFVSWTLNSIVRLSYFFRE
jgi:CRP-like cAMP-binding protein